MTAEGRAWVFLVTAGLLEVGWAVGLKYTAGFTRPGPSTVTLVAMAASMYLLAQAVRTIPVGTGYAVWTGIGAVGTAIIGIAILGEPRDLRRMVSLARIVAGILGLKFSSRA